MFNQSQYPNENMLRIKWKEENTTDLNQYNTLKQLIYTCCT